MSKEKEEVAREDFPYVAVAPGQYLFDQNAEEQSFDCEARLTGENIGSVRRGKAESTHRRMVSSMRCPPSKVNGAAPVPGDPDGTVWPQLIIVEA